MKSIQQIHEIPTPKPTQNLKELTRDLDVAGYCFVAEALGREQIDRLLTRIQEQAEAEAKQFGLARDPVYTTVENLLNKGAVFRSLIEHSLVSELIAYLLGEDYLLSLFDARGIGPGHGAQALHSDQNIIPDRTSVPFIANALWMLVDFTEENGATRVLPGSHLWEDDHPVIQRDVAIWSVFSQMLNSLHDAPQGALQLRRGARGMLQTNPKGSIAAVAPAGTALIFNGKLIHGAGVNSTRDVMRWTILTYYCRPFMRQITNPFLSLSDDVARELPAELRRRIGYRPWTHVGRYEDSMAWAESGHVPGTANRTGELRG